MRLLTLFCSLLIFRVSFADTTWLNQQFAPCAKHDAAYFSMHGQRGNLYERRIFYAANQSLYNVSTYKDQKLNTLSGLSKSYSTHGNVIDSVTYHNGIPLHRALFHNNGRRKTVLIRDSAGVSTYVNSWDSFGNESYIDTFYHDASGRDCHKDTAYSRGIINKEDSVWRLRFWHVASDSIYTTGYFKERLCKTRCRYGSWYKGGLLWDSLLYDDKGRKKEAWYYFRNGRKNAHQRYNADGWVSFAENWDEQGNAAKPDTSFLWPLPAEGFKTWEKNIIRKLNSNGTIDPKVRRDMYGSVHLLFCITAEGEMEYVKIWEPTIYPQIDSMILVAFKETRLWKPAIRHGRRQAFVGRKVFSFVAGVVLKAKDMYY